MLRKAGFSPVRVADREAGRDADGALLPPMVNLEIEAKLTAESY